MAIRIETGGEHLDLPSGYTLEIDLTNPMLNEQGSQSPAITLPLSPKNLRLLGYPTRIDSTTRNDCIDGRICDGPFQRNCKINILSSGPDGIEVSIGTDESLMYEQWQDTRLRDIPSLPVFTPPGSTQAGRVSSLIQICDSIYHRQSDDSDFRIFPVALEFKPDDENQEESPKAVFLNGLRLDANVRKNGAVLGTSLLSAARTVPSGVDSDDVISVPAGYGISPFLRVCRFLHILFDCYGYTLDENVFDTDPQLSELVMLNNTMDCITAGYINYSDLLPDCTINNFLDSLRARFGAVFYIDGSSMTARCVLVRDTLSSGPDSDLTPLHQSRILQTMNKPQMIVIAQDSSYELGGTETDTIRHFLDKYGDYLDVSPSGGNATLLFDRFTQSVSRYDFSTGHRAFFSSMLFPWQRDDAGYEKFSLQGSDKSVPLYHNGNSSDVNFSALPLYLSGVRNSHTSIKASSSFQADETLEQETDLAFCFAHGAYITVDGLDYGVNYGSPYANRPDGQHFVTPDGDEYTYSLLCIGEDGSYNRFWSEFDKVLRHSNRQIETTLRLDRSTLSLLDLSRMKKIFGQVVIPDTVQITLPLSGSLARPSTFRTVFPYGTIDDSSLIDQITRPVGYWYHTSNLREVEDALLADIRSILEDQHDSYEITNIQFIITDREAITDLKAPTAAQIQAGATKTLDYKVRCRVDYSFRDSGFLSWTWGDSSRESFDEDVTETWSATAYSAG